MKKSIFIILVLLILSGCSSLPIDIDQSPAIIISTEAVKLTHFNFYGSIYVDLTDKNYDQIIKKKKLKTIKGLNILKGIPEGNYIRIDFYIKYQGAKTKRYNKFASVTFDQKISRGDILLLDKELYVVLESPKHRTYEMSQALRLMNEEKANSIYLEIQEKHPDEMYNIQIIKSEMKNY
jgi:hypothetical protein